MVYPERMKANLDGLGGLVFSQRVLLELTQAGIAREAAYEIVQKTAMATWREGGRFLDRLKGEKAVVDALGAARLEGLFDMGYHTKHVETIFARVLG